MDKFLVPRKAAKAPIDILDFNAQRHAGTIANSTNSASLRLMQNTPTIATGSIFSISRQSTHCISEDEKDVSGLVKMIASAPKSATSIHDIHSEQTNKRCKLADIANETPVTATGSDTDKAAAASRNEWKQRQSTMMTAADLMIADRTKRGMQQKSLNGWKNQDGKRVYQTFRNGKLVRAEGREAFLCAYSDSGGPGAKSNTVSSKSTTTKRFRGGN